MTNWTDEDALRLDIAMALSKIKTKPRGDRDGIYRKMVAEQIIAHLKLSNWQLHEGAADATAQVLTRASAPSRNSTAGLSLCGWPADDLSKDPPGWLGPVPSPSLDVVPGHHHRTLEAEMAKRELIDTGKDKRYVRRNKQGQFNESDDVGRSLRQDVKQRAKTEVKSGQGDRGDQKRDERKSF